MTWDGKEQRDPNNQHCRHGEHVDNGCLQCMDREALKEEIIGAVEHIIEAHEKNEVHSMDKAADKIAERVLEKLGVSVDDKVTMGEALQIVKWLKKALGTVVMAIGGAVLFVAAKYLIEKSGG